MFHKQKDSKVIDNLGIVFQALDALGTSTVGCLCYLIYFKASVFPSEYRTALIINTLLVLILFPNFNLYLSWRGRSKWKRSITTINAWATVMTILVVTSFAVKNSNIYSRVWFFSWLISGSLYLVLYRIALDLFLSKLRSQGINRKKILVYGAGAVGHNISQNLSNNYEVGFDIHAFIDDNLALHGQKINNVEIYSPDKMLELLKDCQEIWIALPLRADKKVHDILHETRHLTCIVKFIPDIFNFRLLNHSVIEIANMPIIEINGSPLSFHNRCLKRIEDIVLSLIIIMIISPIFIAVSFLVKLTSKGPIIYKQERHGWNGKTIKVYKFRSMSHCHNALFVQATKNDSRITPLGKILRKTSIDELPQFINVLQGRMSIVGPRPHPLAMNEAYKDQVDNYMQRHKVKPGITGWAQINGFRGETDTIEKMEKRIEYDLFYIENWSIALDLKIIFLTVFKGFIGKNAY